MRVGLLTYQNTLNYGAMLQCYALWQSIADLGQRVEVIDYHCAAVERSECVSFSLTAPLSLVKYVVKTPKRRAFNRFKKRMELSEESDAGTLARISARYDCIVVGSDQVWNPAISHDDEAFFLAFERDPARCKSYAASIGMRKFPSDEPYAQYLAHFSSILVRERTALDEVRRLLPDRDDVRVVLDPTLLLEAKRWEEIAQTPSFVRGRAYVLVYAVTDFDLAARVGEEVARRYGCPIVQICQRRIGKIEGAIHVMHASPEEYLGLFAGATAAVVSSFHGMCFSTIFKKDMYCVLPETNATASRFLDLMESLGIESCVVKSPDDVLKVRSVDYAEVTKRLEKMRDYSIAALRESLGA